MFGKLGRLTLVVPILAAGIAMGSARPAEAAFTCNQTITDKVIKTSVIVPAGSECQLERVIVRGGITVRPGGDLDLIDSDVRGNISGSRADDIDISSSVVRGNVSISRASDGDANIDDSDVYGNVAITDSEDGDVRNSNIYGSVVFTDNFGGTAEIFGNFIQINLVCDDVPQGVDTISDNTVEGQVIVSNCPDRSDGGDS